jgi:serine/threonine protein kinase
MPLSPGTRLGQYEVVSLIGTGGMGEVYRARDTKLGRDVALKTLPDAVAHDPERLARFRREAHVLAALNQTHIATIYGLEDTGPTQAIVMELVDSPTLAGRIAQGPLPMDETLAIARQIGAALEAAHELGIVHRDLKPSNVKVEVDGTAKVLDFGLPTALDPTGPNELSALSTVTSPAVTGYDVILGTTAYMSPEPGAGTSGGQTRRHLGVRMRLFEMLTGERLFGGASVTDTIASVVKDQPDLSRVPQAVRRLIRRCVEKDPKRRHWRVRLPTLSNSRRSRNATGSSSSVLRDHRPDARRAF